MLRQPSRGTDFNFVQEQVKSRVSGLRSAGVGAESLRGSRPKAEGFLVALSEISGGFGFGIATAHVTIS